MDDSSMLQYIFLIAGTLLTIIAMFIMILKKGYRILGVLMLIVASLYIYMGYSLFIMQNELDKLDYEAAKQFISNDSQRLVSKSTSNTTNSNSNTQTNLKLTATVDNPAPKKGQKINLLVNGPAGTNIKFVCHYKTKDTSYSGIIGADGTVKIPFDIGSSTSDYEVKVDVVGTSNGKSGTTQTSFTAID